MISAIQVKADNVTIELNGFSIQGPPGDFAVGIFSSARHTTVVNGTVTGFADGVSVGPFSRVQNLHVSKSSVDGIDAGAASLVIGNIVEGSTAFGISVDVASVVKDNTSSNGGTGIVATCPSVIVSNVAFGNFVNISAPSCTVSQNSPAP